MCLRRCAACLQPECGGCCSLGHSALGRREAGGKGRTGVEAGAAVWGGVQPCETQGGGRLARPETTHDAGIKKVCCLGPGSPGSVFCDDKQWPGQDTEPGAHPHLLPEGTQRLPCASSWALSTLAAPRPSGPWKRLALELYTGNLTAGSPCGLSASLKRHPGRTLVCCLHYFVSPHLDSLAWEGTCMKRKGQSTVTG